MTGVKAFRHLPLCLASPNSRRRHDDKLTRSYLNGDADYFIAAALLRYLLRRFEMDAGHDADASGSLIINIRLLAHAPRRTPARYQGECPFHAFCFCFSIYGHVRGLILLMPWILCRASRDNSLTAGYAGDVFTSIPERFSPAWRDGDYQ